MSDIRDAIKMFHEYEEIRHSDINQSVNEHAEEEMADDIRREQRAERIESVAQDLMQLGGSCYPFEPNNFQEALANMDNANALTLAITAGRLDAEITLNLAQSCVMKSAMFSAYLLMVVREYWLKTARHLAEKDMS